MIQAARYANHIIAHSAAAHLRANGIQATVVGDMLAEAPSARLLGVHCVDVVIASSEDLGRARELLREFHEHPATLDDDWEMDTAPDLSRADPALAPACPACERQLPLDAAIEACPECQAPANVVDLILRAHGPDALARCYDADDQDPALDTPNRPRLGSAFMEPIAPVSGAMTRACRSCRRTLDSDQTRGRCPSCGTLYDLSSGY